MGELAQQNGGSEEVKSFGTKLVTDHSASMDQAAALAKSMGATVPNPPTQEAEQEYQHLSALTDAEFDKAFAAHMVKDHETTIQKFEEQAEDSGDEVGQFAKATLPTLQLHLDLAENLAKQR